MIRKYIAHTILSLALLLAVVVPAAPVFAATNVLAPACTRGGADSVICNTSGGDSITTSNGVLHRLIRLIALVAGVAAVLTMVWAGIQYIASQGNPEEVSKAKRTIIYAVIGLVVIVAAQGIINFVIRRI